MIVGWTVRPRDGHGQRATYAEIRRPLHEVGAVLETRAVHGGRSAYNHLLCLAQSNGIAPARVHEVLDLVGLDDVAGAGPAGFRSA